jgi:hypothetical protein
LLLELLFEFTDFNRLNHLVCRELLDNQSRGMSNSEHAARKEERTHRVHPNQATTVVFSSLRKTGSIQLGS